MAHNYKIYTDGACRHNGRNGKGGWAYIRTENGERIDTNQGTASGTTNNRMETTAALIAIESCEDGSDITIITDSMYLVWGINRRKAWERKVREKAKQGTETIPNIDLWQRMWQQMDRCKVAAEWVRGHNGHPENTECDKIANALSHRKLPRKLQRKMNRKEKS